MKLIFYDPDKQLKHSASKKTEKIISMYKPVFCESYETLSKTLVKGGSFKIILVLHIRTQEDIMFFNSLQHLLRGIKIFLIIPKEANDIIKQAYSLNPRLIASSEEDIRLMMESILSYVERINTHS